MSGRTVVITHALRTPMGALGGSLGEGGAVNLGVELFQALLRQANLRPDAVERVWLGQARPDAETPNLAGVVAYRSGIPQSAAAATMTQGAASGLAAILLAAQAIRGCEAEIALAGGVDCPSSIPRLAGEGPWGGHHPGGLWCALLKEPCGMAAEHLAARYELDPEALLDYARQARARAQEARNSGRLEAQVLALRGREGDRGLRIDEYLAVPPAEPEGFPFRSGEIARVPAAAIAPLADGAAAVVLMSGDEARRRDLKPLVRVGRGVTTGTDPRFAGLAGVAAAREVCGAGGLRPGSFDLIELGETFAVDALVAMEELEIPPERVNVNGGDLGLGHAFGATSARMAVNLAHEMARRQSLKGLVALSTCGGLGIAAAFFHESDRRGNLFAMPVFAGERAPGDSAAGRPRRGKRP